MCNVKSELQYHQQQDVVVLFCESTLRYAFFTWLPLGVRAGVGECMIVLNFNGPPCDVTSSLVHSVTLNLAVCVV